MAGSEASADRTTHASTRRSVRAQDACRITECEYRKDSAGPAASGNATASSASFG